MDYELALRTLHPVAQPAFRNFFADLQREMPDVRPFEAHRNPEDQERYLKQGSSKVGAWRSVHQYGFAADIVPCPNGRWTWVWDGWADLHRIARRHGIIAPIEWDKPHHVLEGWNHALRSWLIEQRFT